MNFTPPRFRKPPFRELRAVCDRYLDAMSLGELERLVEQLIQQSKHWPPAPHKPPPPPLVDADGIQKKGI